MDCVVGTSVGAMNGALVALGLYDEAEALWKSMSIERGFQLSAPLRRPDKLFSIQNAGILVRELWKHHGLDITPLRRRLEELVDEQALRASPVEYGLVTYEVTGRKGRELFKEKIPEGRLMDYIMASAAYPGLRRIEIDGKTYLDGGSCGQCPCPDAAEPEKRAGCGGGYRGRRATGGDEALRITDLCQAAGTAGDGF